MIKIFSNKGISIIEALMAALLTAVAVISLLPMQDTSMRTGFRSDYLGRAAGILQSELEFREHQIMHSGAAPTSPINQTITVSGQTGAPGDATFNILTTTIVIVSAPTSSPSWLVTVRVTWTGGPANGISSSIIVTGQAGFK